jgi:hypothetical protein
MNLISVAVSAQVPTKLPVDALYYKEAYHLTADAVVKFIMVTFNNEISETENCKRH